MNSPILIIAYFLFYGATYAFSIREAIKNGNKKIKEKTEILFFFVFISSLFFIEWYYCLLILFASSLFQWTINKIIKEKILAHAINAVLIVTSIILFLIHFFFVSNSPLDVLISSTNSRETLNEIINKLPEEKADKVENEYKRILILSELGAQGKAGIVHLYGEKFEDISFNDIINKINTSDSLKKK